MNTDEATGARYDWVALQQAYAQGRFESGGHELSPHLVFGDGTIWFTEGVELAGAHGVGLPAAGGLFVLMLAGTVVCAVDGNPYVWLFGAGLAVSIGIIAAVVRSTNRKERAARDALRIGVFFTPDAVVIRNGSDERRIERSAVTGIVPRMANKGGNKAVKWLHLQVGSEEVPTDISLVGEAGKAQLERIEAWQRDER
jgi:hypothetical protein